jgi:ribulose-5-phosphate 4-epimerase/fuculose-1-phosphate aldolase
MTQTERDLRQRLAACYRVFAMLGWVEMIYNHITVRRSVCTTARSPRRTW